jgi:hypothetical protein
LGEIWFPSRFWCWELISMVWEQYYDPPCRNIHRSMWQLYLETKFRQIGGLLYLAAILYLGYHGNGRHFEFFQPPNSCHTQRWIFLQSFMKFDERYIGHISWRLLNGNQ